MTSKYYVSPELIEVSRIYQRGKTHVPSEIREFLRLQDGDKLAWCKIDGKIVVKNVKEIS